MEIAGEVFVALFASPLCRGRHYFWCGEALCLVSYVRVERPHVLFKLIVRGKSELDNRAIRKCTIERAGVAVDVRVAAFGVFEPFVEIETGQFGAFVSLLAVEGI